MSCRSRRSSGLTVAPGVSSNAGYKRGRIGIIGTFDTKSEEFAHLRQLILRAGYTVYSIDVGVFDSSTHFPVDYKVSSDSSHRNTSTRRRGLIRNRGNTLLQIVSRIEAVIDSIVMRAGLVGIIGMGGAQGSYLISKALQSLQGDLPKVLVSTCAGIFGDTYVGRSDLILIPSNVDIAGINVHTERVMSSAVSVLCALTTQSPIRYGKAPRIGLTMLGNTTACCNMCRALLSNMGFEVITFHSNGLGGRVLVDLIAQGVIDGLLDVTTTELGNHKYGGLFDAGPDRLGAALRKNIPIVLAPGGLDLLVFKGNGYINKHYAKRTTYVWNNDVLLVRINRKESIMLAAVIADEVRKCAGPVAIVLPTKGFSFLGELNNVFHSPTTDLAFIRTLRKSIPEWRQVRVLDCGINSPQFARSMVAAFMELWLVTRGLPGKSSVPENDIACA